MSPRFGLPATADGARAPRGFILVGVAMFVLVLTILGLSLFSLSGFEAQFFVRSNERSQAFNAAASGIERARFALMEASDSLQVVWQGVPGNELEHVVAVQGGTGFDGGFVDGDSTGLTNWTGPDIWIRSVARAGQARVELVARFDPNQVDEFYKRLITARDIQLDTPTSRWPQVYLSGAIMLPDPSDADTIWNRPPDGPLPSSPLPRPPIQIHSAPLPLPDLDSYFAQKLPLAQPWNLNAASHNYRLLTGVGNVGYFYRPQGAPPATQPIGSPWTVQENQAATITVSGTAVWLADPGIDFLNTVTVQGNPLTDRLIIVARPVTHGEPTGAIEFEGGLISDVPMILVSDGKVRFDSEPIDQVTTRIDYLCIYAHRLQIGGPNPGYTMQLTHTPSLLPNVVDPLIDQLYALNVLPGADVPTATLTTLVSVDASHDRVRLVWHTTGGPGVVATVYRRTVDDDWIAIGAISPDGNGYLHFEDTAVTAGTRYGYRLGVIDAGAEVFVGETWAEVPILQLAIRAAKPNPTRDGRLLVEFTLRDASPARLELLDVAGRVVTSKQVGVLGPGTHALDVSQGGALRAGIYFLRLTQGGNEVRARATVLR